MEARVIAPKPGDKARAVGQGVYPLPKGLPHGSTVTVIACDGQDVAVKDEQGQEWRLRHWQADVGTEYLIDGKWRREADPVVLDALEATLRQIQGEKWAEGVENVRGEVIKSLTERLKRHRRIS
jgi:hypothetical protein